LPVASGKQKRELMRPILDPFRTGSSAAERRTVNGER
jgi:hypothetical protein